MSSEDHESFEDQFPDQVRKKALEMFDHQPETKAEEYNFKEFFTRILQEKDWTDKLESAIVKVLNRFHPRTTDTKLSKELKALIPDMKEVAKAYDEMTTGYKEFIQNILDDQAITGFEKRKRKLNEASQPSR